VNLYAEKPWSEDGRPGPQVGVRWVRSPASTTWPQSLKTAAGIMLTTRHSVFIVWDPELICLDNDAYTAAMGPEKEPRDPRHASMPGNVIGATWTPALS
jgi:hypothetical protein